MSPPTCAKEIIPALLSGETLALFSTVTVYATNAGAADRTAQEGLRLQQPGELARAFGDLSVDPDAVKVESVEFPTVGDATLADPIEAAATVVNVTVLVVGFLEGKTTAAVGSLRITMPPVEELAPLANLVAQRIATASSELEMAEPCGQHRRAGRVSRFLPRLGAANTRWPPERLIRS